MLLRRDEVARYFDDKAKIMKPTSPILLLVLIAMLALASCSGAATPAPGEAVPSQTTSAAESAATDTPQPAPTDTTAPEPTVEPSPTAEPSPTPEPTATAEPSPIEEPVQDEPTIELSPAEMLAAQFTAAPTAAGEVILVTGRVLDLNDNPLPGAAVEIWQTDANGVYDHPGDSSTGSRDQGFQFYGTSIAGDDGTYVFRTVRPGYYEPRPKHIHVKVKLDGATALTSQFYFDEDRAGLTTEGLFAQAGNLGELLILRAADSIETADDAWVAVLTNDLVINTGGAGSLTATPAQGEGPYYPVVAVANFDNDLAAVP